MFEDRRYVKIFQSFHFLSAYRCTMSSIPSTPKLIGSKRGGFPCARHALPVMSLSSLLRKGLMGTEGNAGGESWRAMRLGRCHRGALGGRVVDIFQALSDICDIYVNLIGLRSATSQVLLVLFSWAVKPQLRSLRGAYQPGCARELKPVPFSTHTHMGINMEA